MKKLKILIHTYIDKFYSVIEFTPKETIMWIEVPMSCNSVEHKYQIMTSAIKHMEHIIKINKK